MRKITLLSLLSLIHLFLTSCSDDSKESDLHGKVQFGLSSDINANGRSESTPSSVLVTILDPSGEINEQLILYSFGDSYLSEPLELEKETFKLTQYLILDEEDQVIFASPLAGSELADYVHKPLPIIFSVEENQVTSLYPEVLSVTNTVPEDFGLVTFGFEEIQTINLPVAATTLKDGSWEMVSAILNVTIEDEDGKATWSKDFNLNDTFTSIKLKGGGHNYKFTAKREDYKETEEIYNWSTLKEIEALAFKMIPLTKTLKIDLSELSTYDSTSVTFTKGDEVITKQIENVEDQIGYVTLQLDEGDWDVEVAVYGQVEEWMNDWNGPDVESFSLYSYETQLSVANEREISVTPEWDIYGHMTHILTGVTVKTNLDDRCSVYTSLDLNDHAMAYGYADVFTWDEGGGVDEYLFVECYGGYSGIESFCGIEDGENLFDKELGSGNDDYYYNDLTWECNSRISIDWIDQITIVELIDGTHMCFFYGIEFDNEISVGSQQSTRSYNKSNIFELIEQRKAMMKKFK